MLKQLTLKNFVVIESLEVRFDTGLSTITGESGAGKSILLSALNLVLGARASADVVRPKSERADVIAEFDLGRLPGISQRLQEAELLDEDPDLLIIRRSISAQGRSRALVNGIPVTTQFLRSLSILLIDIHAQNEHIQLADRGTQLQLLDDYAGTTSAAAEVATHFKNWQQGQSELDVLGEQLETAADRKELLTYQLEELDELGLSDGEIETLFETHRRLAGAHEIQHAIQRTIQSVEQLDDLHAAQRQLSEIQDSADALTSARGNLDTALSLLDDAQRDLVHYADQVVIDPQALSDVEQRLDLAQGLARKHKVKVEALFAHQQALRTSLEDMDSDRTAFDALQKRVAKSEAAFNKAAKNLSAKRRKAAPKFAASVTHFLQQLGISAGRFEIEFDTAVSERGLDKLEYLVSTNPDFPAGPLTQIASGGEQTRISLSIQIVAAQHSHLPCLILDEADVGVGGTTADTIGRILRNLAQHTQVICITHAPQVAALGNHHFRVVKTGNQTSIEPLMGDERIDELARMLAGADINEKSRAYATSLLTDAANEGE